MMVNFLNYPSGSNAHVVKVVQRKDDKFRTLPESFAQKIYQSNRVM